MNVGRVDLDADLGVQDQEIRGEDGRASSNPHWIPRRSSWSCTPAAVSLARTCSSSFEVSALPGSKVPMGCEGSGGVHFSLVTILGNAPPCWLDGC